MYGRHDPMKASIRGMEQGGVANSKYPTPESTGSDTIYFASVADIKRNYGVIVVLGQ